MTEIIEALVDPDLDRNVVATVMIDCHHLFVVGPGLWFHLWNHSTSVTSNLHTGQPNCIVFRSSLTTGSSAEACWNWCNLSAASPSIDVWYTSATAKCQFAGLSFWQLSPTKCVSAVHISVCPSCTVPPDCISVAEVVSSVAHWRLMHAWSFPTVCDRSPHEWKMICDPVTVLWPGSQVVVRVCDSDYPFKTWILRVRAHGRFPYETPVYFEKFLTAHMFLTQVRLCAWVDHMTNI